ncbi:hypothetical protein GCM10023168_26250 [Fodinibacter luteus]|uniref:DUF2304 domain-containing protein n=1 Tax=Fodinibacter luteus TaxID=552064 RepID=A0ABP8KKC9_9MICO
MNTDAYWLGLVGGLVVLFLSVELVRRRHVRGRLAVAWIVLGLLAVGFALFPSALGWLSSTLRVQVPLNLVLFCGVLFLLVISMQLASEVGRLEARTRRLAEEVAILGAERRHPPEPDPAADGASGVHTDDGAETPGPPPHP